MLRIWGWGLQTQAEGFVFQLEWDSFHAELGASGTPWGIPVHLDPDRIPSLGLNIKPSGLFGCVFQGVNCSLLHH